MSSWSDKFEKRLHALTDQASKESIQTLAKWMGFNRKHGDEFAKTLCKNVRSTATSSSPARQWVYWQLIHQVLLQEKDSSKWDRLEPLRVAIGEHVVVPLYSKSTGDLPAKLKPLLKEWDEVNVFGGPTIVNLIKRSMSQSPKAKSKDVHSDADADVEESKTESKAEPSKDSAESNAAATTTTMTTTTLVISTAVAKEQQQEDAIETPSKPEKPKLLRRQLSLEEVSFDFEAQGIPAGKVDSRDFLEPCRAIATLQIARDLRSDATVRLPSILSTIPDEVKQLCETLQKEENVELPEEVVTKLSVELSDDFLDLNLDEMLDNLATFREIVQKMRTARKRLAHLLVRSRCQFGATEAADVYYGLDEKATQLQKRKELLSDAMDLEGLEHNEKEDKVSGLDTTPTKNLEPFSWYNKGGGRDAKRQKV